MRGQSHRRPVMAAPLWRLVPPAQTLECSLPQIEHPNGSLTVAVVQNGRAGCSICPRNTSRKRVLWRSIRPHARNTNQKQKPEQLLNICKPEPSGRPSTTRTRARCAARPAATRPPPRAGAARRAATPCAARTPPARPGRAGLSTCAGCCARRACRCGAFNVYEKTFCPDINAVQQQRSQATGRISST